MANYMMGRKEEVQFHCQETIFFLFWFEALEFCCKQNCARKTKNVQGYE